jgi:hypothetical protein
LFAKVATYGAGAIRADIPELASVHWPLLLLMALAFAITFVLKWNMARMLVACALLGVAFNTIPAYV